MKHLKWISFVLAIFFCFSLVAPDYTDAAPSKKSQVKIHSKKSKASSAKSNKSDKKREVKETASHRKNQGKSQRLAEKSRQMAEKSANKSKSREDRDVWLKRARDSEVLTGKASWYGKDFHNKATASGLNYDMYTFTAAHRTLPMGTVVKVTDQHNGKSVMVCVTDRGPYVNGRIIDLSYAAAKQLDLNKRGVAPVKLEVVSDEKGSPLKSGHAYFIRYGAKSGKSKVGPFHVFADAAAMHEALRQAHPEAELILEKSTRK